MVLSALADGSSVITENIFENRFMFASELVRMGADIRIESHHAMIHGVKGFSGAQVTSPDLRGGAALVVAGLIATALPRSRPSITSNVAMSSLSKNCRHLVQTSSTPLFPIPSSTNAGCLCLIIRSP